MRPRICSGTRPRTVSHLMECDLDLDLELDCDLDLHLEEWDLALEWPISFPLLVLYAGSRSQ